jgi:hypothetical protein
MSRSKRKEARGSGPTLPREATDRVIAQAERAVYFAGRQWDALAKADPAVEIARIHVEELVRWRLPGMVTEIGALRFAPRVDPARRCGAAPRAPKDGGRGQ